VATRCSVCNCLHCYQRSKYYVANKKLDQHLQCYLTPLQENSFFLRALNRLKTRHKFAMNLANVNLFKALQDNVIGEFTVGIIFLFVNKNNQVMGQIKSSFVE
jgi:hypothetical protein